MDLTIKEAIFINKNTNWKSFDYKTIFLFQISQEKLCLPFSLFHKATEKALQRQVYTHEFSKPKLLLKEYFKMGDE